MHTKLGILLAVVLLQSPPPLWAEAPAGFDITLAKHLYVFPSGDRELVIQETWPPNGGSPANARSAVEFLVQYQVTLTNQLTASSFAYFMEIPIHTPIESGVRDVPFADHLPDLIDGTYSALVEAKVWKKTGKHYTPFGEDATSGTVFVLVNAHKGYAIASPTAETSALTDVTNLYPVGPNEPPRMAGVIIPPGAVTRPTLVWVDPVINDEANWLVGQTGPLYSFGPETTFARPVTLVIPYDASLNEIDGVREVMNLMAHVGPNDALDPLLFTNIDIYSDTVTASTTHFSLFGIFRAISAVVSIFKPIIQVAAAVIGVVVSVIVQATQSTYNDMYVGLIKPFRDMGFQPGTCLKDFEACLVDLQPRDQYYLLGSAAYLELFSANEPGHFLDQIQNPTDKSRKERIRKLIHGSLVLLSWEAANFGLNSGLNAKYEEARELAPFTGPFQAKVYDPNLNLTGMRGWGDKNHKIDGELVGGGGWHTFSEYTGGGLIGILETALAVRQFVAEDSTRCLANAPIFQDSADPCDPVVLPIPDSAPYSGVKQLHFINPNTSNSDSQINDCLSKWWTNGKKLEGADASCFSIAQNIEKLTYAQADALLTAFSIQVMEWWIRNASSEITSSDPNWGTFGHYFWYFAQGSVCVSENADGSCSYYSNESVVHNVNVLMGRAAFLLYRLTNDTKYRDIAIRVQRVYKLAHFPCREEGTGYMSSCHAYGALKSWVRTQPSSPKSWDWAWKTIDGKEIRQTEDIEHAGSSASLNGLMAGDSLFNKTNYGVSAPGQNLELTVNQRQYYSSTGCEYYNTFQCTNAHLGSDMRLEWWLDSNNNAFIKPMPVDPIDGTYSMVESFAYPRETINGITNPNYNVNDPATWQPSTIRKKYQDQIGGGLSPYYFVEGSDSDAFETLYQWYTAYEKRYLEVNNVSIATGQTYKYMTAFLAWKAKKRAGHTAYVPDAHPAIASVSPSRVAIGGHVDLGGKYFSNSRFHLWVDGVSYQPAPENWGNTLVRAELSSIYGPGKRMLKLSVGGPTSDFPLAPLYSNEVEVEVMAPYVTSVSPSRVRKGDGFTIYGMYFDDDAGDVIVDGVPAFVVTWMDSFVMVLAPLPNTLGAPRDGVVSLALDVHGYKANSSIELYEGPRISSISPVAVGGRMTVLGDSFRGLDPARSQLIVGGQIVPPLSWSNTTIVADVPVSLGLGTHDVQVTDSRNTQNSQSNVASVETRAPVLMSFIPTRGAALSPLQITGQYFGHQPYGVTIAGQSAQINSWTDSEIGVTVPDLPVGVFNVVAQVAGFPSNTVAFTVAAVIDSVTPSQITGGDLVTINGYLGAVPGRITIRGVELPIVDWQLYEAKALLPATIVAGQTEVVVTVNGISTRSDVTVYPSLSSVSPGSGTIDTEFLVMGSNFGTTSRVFFSGERGQIESISPTEIVVSPPREMSQAGPVPVLLTVNGIESSPIFVSMIPQIISSVSTGYVGSQFTITGYNFGSYGEPAPVVRIGSMPIPVVQWSAGSNRVVVSVPSFVSPGEQTLTVEAGGLQSQSVAFRVLPKVTSFEPNYGIPGSLITIGGSGFGASEADIQVYFYGIAATISGVTRDANGTIVECAVVIPAVDFGRHGVRVVINGIEAIVGNVEVMFPVSTNPAKVPVGSGFKIVGGAFGSRPRVSIDGMHIDFVSSNSSEIVIGEFGYSSYPGEHQIIVEASEGDGLGTLVVVPRLDTVSPVNGKIGDEIVLTGAGFTAQSKVFLGAMEAPLLSWTYNTLRVKVPPTSVGSALIHVVVGGLYDSRHLDFEVVSSSLITAVSGGFGHTCVVADGGKVKCWGRNDLGQLGTGDRVSSASPREVIGLTSVRDVTVALDSVCALKTNEEVWCWGDNALGQLGNISPIGGSSTIPGKIALNNIKAIVAGYRSFCAINVYRQVQCWGWNYYGQLGSYSSTESWGLTIVEGLPGPVDSIAGGGGSFCAVVSDKVYCWGINNYGQAGGTASEFIVHPARVISGTLAGISKVSGGQYHYCLIAGSEGNVQCWGRADLGQLGDGVSQLARPVAMNVVGLADITEISLHNADAYACAASAGGAVYCWGGNSSGQTGQDPVFMPIVMVPLPVSGVSNVSILGTGLRHTCAIHSAATGLKCWGSNAYQQLGVTSPPFSYSPIEVWLLSFL